MFGPFPNPRVAVEIGGILGRVSERIRQRRKRSVDREELGNRARTEPSDTDELINDFESAVQNELELVGRKFVAERAEFNVEFYPTNLSTNGEHKFGVDFGVRLQLTCSPELDPVFVRVSTARMPGKEAQNEGQTTHPGQGHRQAA